MTPDLAPSWLDREAYPFESRWLTVPAGRLHYVDEVTEDHDPAKGWSPAARPGSADDRVRDAPSEPRPQPLAPLFAAGRAQDRQGVRDEARIHALAVTRDHPIDSVAIERAHGGRPVRQVGIRDVAELVSGLEETTTHEKTLPRKVDDHVVVRVAGPRKGDAHPLAELEVHPDTQREDVIRRDRLGITLGQQLDR